jgi:hypothetical protein
MQTLYLNSYKNQENNNFYSDINKLKQYGMKIMFLIYNQPR